MPWLLLIWAGIVLWAYAEPSRVPYHAVTLWLDFVPPFWTMTPKAFVGHAAELLRLAGFTFLTTALGRGLLSRSPELAGLARLEVLALSHALGLGAFGTGIFLLAAAGRLSTPGLCALTGFTALLAGWLLRDKARKIGPWLRAVCSEARPSRTAAPAAVGVAAALSVAGFYALGEEIFYDALVYHLALPSHYLREGGLVAAETLLYSGIPMLFEMLYAWALALGGEALPALIHWSSFASSAVLLVGFARRAGAADAGWWGAMLFLSAPFIGDAAHRAGVEGGSVLWILSAVVCASKSAEAEPGAGGRWAALCGVFVGFAAASKYTNWPLAAVLPLVLARFGRRPRELALYAAAAGLLVLPWVLKNAFFYGNPIFPFFHEHFSLEGDFPVDWRTLHADAKGRDWGAILRSPAEALRLLAHPWYATMEGKSDHDMLGPAFLLLAPTLAAARQSTPAARLWAAAALAAWLCWWPFSSIPRFASPALALFSFAVAAALCSARPAWLSRALMGLAVLVSLGNLTDSAAFAARLGQWPLLLGQGSRETYRLQGRPTYPAPIAGAFSWLESNTKQEAVILLVADGRSHGVPRRSVPNSLMDRPVFFHALSLSADGAALRDRLRHHGVTHLVVNMAWLARLSPPPDASPAHAAVLRDFLSRHAALKHEDRDLKAERWTLVYEIDGTKAPNDPRSDALAVWFSRRKN